MKRIMMIAYHFPPMAGSSGIQRTLRFARHLPEFGWEPLVLTAHPRAYERVSEDQLDDVPAGTVVKRACAFDSARHFAVNGRYPAFVARPDRWMSWFYGAIPAGLELIRKYRPRILWSTYPIATAHRIGYALHKLTGVDWVADFRDPMAQDGYPADPRTWRRFKRIEEKAVRNASASVFVTPGAAAEYRRRYPDVPDSRLVVIENGYDEESFASCRKRVEDTRKPLVPGAFTLLHSGVVYPSERDPRQLFRALRRMREAGQLGPRDFRLRLRAPAHETLLKAMLDEHGITDLVELSPAISYRDALQEMLDADGLLVLQAANCNEQIPAKVYEYLRCRRPILALTDPAGDTAGLLRRAGVEHIGRLNCADDIADALRRFVDESRRGVVSLPHESLIRDASRAQRTRSLAELLDTLPASAGRVTH